MARTFTEAEAQRIFARIAEKQRAADTDAAGLSLGDLEEAAHAAGLDASLVAAAAAEIDAPQSGRSLLGAREETLVQRVVRGPVSEEAWAAMVATARVEFGRTGTAGQIGQTREWTAATGAGNAQATTRLALEPVGGDTRIVVTRSARDAVLGFTVGGSITGVMSVIFGMLYAFGVDPELWIPALILGTMAIVFLGGTQVGLRAWHRAQVRRCDALLDRLELAARADAPEAVPGRPAGRIDPVLLDAEALDLATDEAPDSAAAPRRRDRA